MKKNKYDLQMKNLRFRYINNRRIQNTETDVAEFEKKIGFRLPSDYKEFVLDYGRCSSHGRIGYVHPGDVKKEGVSLESFYGLNSDDSFDLILSKEAYDDVLPSHLLPFAGGAGGEYLIGLAREEVGKVFWWPPTGGFNSIEQDFIFLAPDFDTFMGRLVCED